MPGPYTSRPHDLSSSLSSLDSRPSRHQSSSIAKSYRQAAQLFLTRRLPEALSTIEPVITPPSPSDQPDGHHADGDDPSASLAPIATASRGTRVKVWSFYLTFLNAVVELGPEEGKAAFGAPRWKALVSKARDGGVWEDVVRDGYGGVEGDVDAEVVVNLATLLLTHSPTQHLTQTRLESYLSATAHPSLDITAHMSRPAPPRRSSSHNNNGTSTPRDLHTRLKLLELYTLHVLPRNEQWEYAAQFIDASEVLDEERREAFLAALQGLREERDGVRRRDEELRDRQERERKEAEAEEQRQREEEERAAAEEEEESRRKRKRDEQGRRRAQQQQQGSSGSSKDSPKRNTATETGHSRTPSSSHPSHPSRPQPPTNKKPLTPPSPAAGLYTRASALLVHIQASVLAAARNPAGWLRAALFLVAFLLAFGRAEVRERVRRVVGTVWRKVRGTVGMGVRVSYV